MDTGTKYRSVRYCTVEHKFSVLDPTRGIFSLFKNDKKKKYIKAVLSNEKLPIFLPKLSYLLTS